MSLYNIKNKIANDAGHKDWDSYVSSTIDSDELFRTVGDAIEKAYYLGNKKRTNIVHDGSNFTILENQLLCNHKNGDITSIDYRILRQLTEFTKHKGK